MRCHFFKELGRSQNARQNVDVVLALLQVREPKRQPGGVGRPVKESLVVATDFHLVGLVTGQ